MINAWVDPVVKRTYKNILLLVLNAKAYFNIYTGRSFDPTS
jgi:hypothetical protein